MCGFSGAASRGSSQATAALRWETSSVVCDRNPPGRRRTRQSVHPFRQPHHNARPHRFRQFSLGDRASQLSEAGPPAEPRQQIRQRLHRLLSDLHRPILPVDAAPAPKFIHRLSRSTGNSPRTTAARRSGERAKRPEQRLLPVVRDAWAYYRRMLLTRGLAMAIVLVLALEGARKTRRDSSPEPPAPVHRPPPRRRPPLLPTSAAGPTSTPGKTVSRPPPARPGRSEPPPTRPARSTRPASSYR